MKKILLPIMLFLIPNICSAQEVKFIHTYHGSIFLSNGEHITYEKTDTYLCDVGKLGYDNCSEETKKQAREACISEGISTIGGREYLTRKCSIN